MSFDLALVNSDISIKSDGTVRTVENTSKLRQDIVKIILTPLGSVRFHTWYGSDINENTIGDLLPDNLLFDNISSGLTESLDRLVTLQRAQASQQRVDLAELIAVIQQVEVQRDIRDLRIVNVRVAVLSKSLSPVEETFSIRG